MRRLIPVVSFALAACATPGTGIDTVQVDTQSGGQALAGATCMVVTRVGSHQLVTPGIVNVGSERGDMHVICDKPGYRTSEFIYRAGAPGGSSLGLGVGSGRRVGFGFGLSVPLGAATDRFPARVVVDMNPQ